MKRGPILFALSLALPGIAFAAAPAAKVPARPAVAPTARPSPLQLQPGVHRITLSPEGNATAQRILGAPDPRAPQFQAEMTAIRQDQQKLLATQPIDMAKLASIVQRSESLQAEVLKAKNDRLLDLLKALSESDRVALLQQIFNPAQPQNSKPAVPPAVAPPPKR